MSADFDPAAYLQSIASMADSDIDPALGALSLCAPFHPGISVARYVFHLEKIKKDVAAHHAARRSAGAGDDGAASCLKSLIHIMSGEEDYAGDTHTYDHLDNADLMRVIDRRRGLPAALAILYISTAAAQGWDVYPLSFPGHVLCRMDRDGQRLIFDPFDRGRVMQAPDLRAMVKRIMGANTELSADWFEPTSRRDLLIRLQNNIKLRQIAADDYAAAIQTIETMRVIAPDEYRLLFDAGVIYARLGQRGAAIKALEEYMEAAPSARDRQDAAMLLREIRGSLQ